MSSEVGIVFHCAHTVKAAGLLGQSSASGAVLQTAPTLTARPHRNDSSQEDAKQEQPADGGLLSYTKNFRKNFVYFSKNIPRGSFTIKKCFDRIKAQFIHSQSSNAKTVSRYLGEEVA